MTSMKTQDGLVTYDLDPLASENWIVAGPPGWLIADIDPDDLPDGFRWVDDEEWDRLNNPENYDDERTPMGHG